jgi:hypothetical protein
MSTLSFNGTNQYVEFSTLGTAIQNLPTGPQTLLALERPSALTGAFHSVLGVCDSGRTAMLAHWGHSNLNGSSQRCDVSRAVADGVVYTDIVNWGMHFETLDTADTHDVQFHSRNHTGNGAFAQSSATSSPAYGVATTSGGFVQVGRWLTSDYFVGDIALVALWDRKLSNAQRDELYASDRTSDIYNVAGGPPIFLVEMNVAESSLVNIGTAAATRVAPGNAPTLTGGDPDRWTFDAIAAGLRDSNFNQNPGFRRRRSSTSSPIRI